MNDKNLEIILATSLIVAIFILEEGDKDIFDFSEIVAIVCAYLFYKVQKHIRVVFDEKERQEEDPNSLIKKYPCEKGFYQIRNSINKQLVELPIVIDATLDDKGIIIKDNPEFEYELPPIIEENQFEIIGAYDNASTYNQLNIRVNSWDVLSDDTFCMNTGRTTYYKSLLTNRAIDYKINNQISVRDILQFGPFLPSLEDSKLSNHLGFDMVVFYTDVNGKVWVPVLRRDFHNSIGKGFYGAPVSASMKSKYCLQNSEFTVQGMFDSIRREINDELGVNLFVEDVEIECLAAYRGVYEGVKPQLLCFCDLRLDTLDLDLSNNQKSGANHFSIEHQRQKDGKSMLLIGMEEFKHALFDSEFMYIPLTKNIINLRKIEKRNQVIIDGNDYVRFLMKPNVLFSYDYVKKHRCDITQM